MRIGYRSKFRSLLYDSLCAYCTRILRLARAFWMPSSTFIRSSFRQAGNKSSFAALLLDSISETGAASPTLSLSRSTAVALVVPGRPGLRRAPHAVQEACEKCVRQLVENLQEFGIAWQPLQALRSVECELIDLAVILHSLHCPARRQSDLEEPLVARYAESSAGLCQRGCLFRRRAARGSLVAYPSFVRRVHLRLVFFQILQPLIKVRVDPDASSLPPSPGLPAAASSPTSASRALPRLAASTDRMWSVPARVANCCA